MRYWLLKSEPDVFGIDALAAAPRRTSGWEGVRNYQARNMLRDDFRQGDRAFFYHSSCAVPGVAGVVKVVVLALRIELRRIGIGLAHDLDDARSSCINPHARHAGTARA